MNAPDPADTLSGSLPSLPPPLRDNGGPLDALHPWHPWDDDHTEASPFFTRLINQCGAFATRFAVEERERAKYADRDAVPVRRFMQPLPPIDAGPAALPPPPLPVPYRELAPEVREREFDTLTGTAVLFAAEEPGRHRHRGSNGRFVATGGT